MKSDEYLEGKRSFLKAQAESWSRTVVADVIIDATMDEELMRSLPGADIVLSGIADLAAGRESVGASAVQSASSRLTRAGIPVPNGDGDGPAAHRLYRQLGEDLGDAAHARHNAILERVASFARAAEIAQPR